MQDDAMTVEGPSIGLAGFWLKDQAFAFAATLLGAHDPFSEPRPLACARFLTDNTDEVPIELLSDSTLKLIATIDEAYHHWYTEKRLKAMRLKEDGLGAIDLSRIVDRAKLELHARDQAQTSDLNRVLISHTVYLLRRPHLSCLDILKWLHRAVRQAVPGIKSILVELQRAGSEKAVQVEELLDLSRDVTLQTHDRLHAIDSLYDLLLESARPETGSARAWLLRILTSYRNSHFCWPLLVEGREREPHEAGGDPDANMLLGFAPRGISLPISLFVVEDGQSTWRSGANANGQKIWFKYGLIKTDAKASAKARFQPGRDGLPSRIGNFRFGFFQEWWRSFQVGLDVAKKLWVSQYGGAESAISASERDRLCASLNVDLRAACDIVETVFSAVSEASWERLPSERRLFTVGGRSAESYWAQCILSKYLPARDLPLGVCTGTVDFQDGEMALGVVAGLTAKLDYADRAAFSRVILPGDGEDYVSELRHEFSTSQPHQLEASVSVSNSDNRKEADVEAFLAPLPVDGRDLGVSEWLARNGLSSTLDINFARNARAVADEMQPSGWKRVKYLRTPEFRREFSEAQKRLFIRDSMKSVYMRRQLKSSDHNFYDSRRWVASDERAVKQLDQLLTSATGRSVLHVQRSSVRRVMPGLTVEQALGRWAAWKDNQMRGGTGYSYRTSGLGVLALKSADGDSETRLWSALAESLSASERWWDEFQWADLPKAAGLLGQLLCNRMADPRISVDAAPDITIIFDDAGFVTRRTNMIFPADFHHQFIDLLNPRHPTNNKPDYLDAAIKSHDRSARSVETKIIVLLADDQPAIASRTEVAIRSEDRKLLEKLSVFRFGFSYSAAFSAATHDERKDLRTSWAQLVKAINRLVDFELLAANRSQLYVTPLGRALVCDLENKGDHLQLARAHLAAARALCPVLNPRSIRSSGNRDRQLEPESVLEANWHLNEAFSFVPQRFMLRREHRLITESQALLTFLRSMPDWDTVVRLRVNHLTRQDSVELSHYLLNSQREFLKHEPPSPVVGLAIETIGRSYRAQPHSASKRERSADVLVAMVETAITRLKEEQLSSREWRRRMRHLLSRQLFALRMLGLPLTDPKLSASRAYIDSAVAEVLKPAFLEGLGEGREGLDDFPISPDCWRMLWQDGHRDSVPNQTLTLVQRSRYAYAAARANLSKTRADRMNRASWDEPWIAYFGLTRKEDIEPKQLAAPLNTWWSEYGVSEDASQAFGQRVLDLQPHAQKTKRGEWQEHWLAELSTATGNLWRYVVADEKAERIVGAPVAPALRLIRVLALQEVLPAWRFVKDAGPDWLQRWPVLASTKPGRHWPPPATDSYGFVADEWTALSRSVIGHKAGWVEMLASLKLLETNKRRLALVRSWLSASQVARIEQLTGSDPEDLLSRSRDLPISRDFGLKRHAAGYNVERLMNLQGASDFQILTADERAQLEGFVDQIVVQGTKARSPISDEAGKQHDATD